MVGGFQSDGVGFLAFSGALRSDSLLQINTITCQPTLIIRRFSQTINNGHKR